MLHYGDRFYYIEVWDKQILRDNKISSILGEGEFEKTYLNGSQRSLNKVNRIECAIFWKNKESAEWRISTLKRSRPKDHYIYLIKSLTREEFINIIPDVHHESLKSHTKFYWEKNKELKIKEVSYKRKLENPWNNIENQK